MVLVLVDEGVELRNEAAIEKGSLRELCEAVRYSVIFHTFKWHIFTVSSFIFPQIAIL